ncbi:MAG TPA: nuclear transport factor 2 family protein [Chloroflexota bacterium]|nr:nuclear transport factor 2 family protein [Chloroflexota bacterium]
MGRARYGVRDEIRDTAESFYRAVTKKSIRSIDSLWAHEPYASVAGRSGHIRQGWPQVRGYWEQRFQQLGDIRVVAQLRNSVCHAVGDVAWLSGTEIRKVIDGDQVRTEELRMTAVLERKGTRWQIVSYHASEPAGAAVALAPAS